jgi:hypothetical protein
MSKAAMGRPSPPKSVEGRERLRQAVIARKGDPRYKSTEASRQKLSFAQRNRSVEHQEKLNLAVRTKAAQDRELALARTEKLCGRCLKVLPLDCFVRRAMSADGRQANCRTCRNARRREENAILRMNVKE